MSAGAIFMIDIAWVARDPRGRQTANLADLRTWSQSYCPKSCILLLISEHSQKPHRQGILELEEQMLVIK